MNDFLYIIFLVNQLFGVEILEDDAIEIGMMAWNLIGNKKTRIYRATVDVNCNDGSVELPCNADIIESVTRCGEDYLYTTNYTEFDNYDSRFIENYIESRKGNKHPLYSSGGFVKYYQNGNTLYVDKSISKVKILYRGIELDNDGLPQISDKEAIAIATYIAYITQWKKGIITMNKEVVQMALLLKADWEKKCDAARVKQEIWSQNDMDVILDANSSWNRKMFGKSYKPYK